MWGGSKEEASQFGQFLNSNPMGLSFTFNHETNLVNYLDVTLRGDQGMGVKIQPYRKSTASNSVLLATSCHPSHVTNNLPVGELIRMKRNSSDMDSYSIVSKRAPTIGNIILPSLYNSKEQKWNWLDTNGFFKCHHNKCLACQFPLETKKFASASRGIEFPIASFINCNTKYGI